MTTGETHADEVYIDVSLVRRLLADQFPRWARLPITPAVPQGWDNRTFRLGENMSVRLPSAEPFEANRIRREMDDVLSDHERGS